MKIFKLTLFVVLSIFLLESCQRAEGNQTGSEYMPDMVYSIAYEANVSNYYYWNQWASKEEYYERAKPRVPVKGTVPRTMDPNFAMPVIGGGKVYPYPNTEAGRAKAMEEIVDNPYPITDYGLAQGKELYNIYCGICHGEKADGGGYLVRDDGGKYPVQPANFLLDEHINASNGRYYHAIMQGRNLMGAYKEKINEKERWQVIHYIRSLQAKQQKLEYSQVANTLNAHARPAGKDYVRFPKQVLVETHVDTHGSHSSVESHSTQEVHNVVEKHPTTIENHIKKDNDHHNDAHKKSGH